MITINFNRIPDRMKTAFAHNANTYKGVVISEVININGIDTVCKSIYISTSDAANVKENDAVILEGKTYYVILKQKTVGDMVKITLSSDAMFKVGV